MKPSHQTTLAATALVAQLYCSTCRSLEEAMSMYGRSTVPFLKACSGGGTMTAVAGEHTRDGY